MEMPSQVDAAEEKRRVRESVKNNIITFVVLCAAIRLCRFCSILINACARINCANLLLFSTVRYVEVKILTLLITP